MTTKSKIALALAGAIGIGVFMGLMIAPEKGSDSRKKMKDKAGKLMGGLSRLFAHTGHDDEVGKVSQQEVTRGKGVSTTM